MYIMFKLLYIYIFINILCCVVTYISIFNSIIIFYCICSSIINCICVVYCICIIYVVCIINCIRVIYFIFYFIYIWIFFYSIINVFFFWRFYIFWLFYCLLYIPWVTRVCICWIPSSTFLISRNLLRTRFSEVVLGLMKNKILLKCQMEHYYISILHLLLLI